MLTDLAALGAGVVIGVLGARWQSEPTPHTQGSRESTALVVTCTACRDTFPSQDQAERHLTEEHGMALSGTEAMDVLEIDYLEY